MMRIIALNTMLGAIVHSRHSHAFADLHRIFSEFPHKFAIFLYTCYDVRYAQYCVFINYY